MARTIFAAFLMLASLRRFSVRCCYAVQLAAYASPVQAALLAIKQRAAGKGVVLSRLELHMSGSGMRGQQLSVLA